MMALVWGGTLNSSAANLSTAVKGAASGTLNLRRQPHDADQDDERPPAANRGTRSGPGRGGGKRRYSHFEGELGVGGEDHLERYLPAAAAALRGRRRRRHGSSVGCRD